MTDNLIKCPECDIALDVAAAQELQEDPWIILYRFQCFSCFYSNYGGFVEKKGDKDDR